jgi:diaminopimelate epimerase
MTVNFQKYQGTGNDFIMIDNRQKGIGKKNASLIEHLCNRKFGIGADGLILLQEKKSYDFEMVYFNGDGRESTMCGNGGRCLVKFAHHLGLVKNNCRFLAIDGPHDAEVLRNGHISLKMKDVNAIEKDGANYILNTGSPHYVIFVKDVQPLAVVEEAKKIRYSKRFAKEGINVNFVEITGPGKIIVRTYERGVEDETLSCGTGVVASVIALACRSGKKITAVKIKTPGGNLAVSFEQEGNSFKEIRLIGPAEKSFEGIVTI